MDVRDDAGQRLAAKLGDGARYLHADLSIEAAVAAFGRLDMPGNNARTAGANKAAMGGDVEQHPREFAALHALGHWASRTTSPGRGSPGLA